MVRTRSQDFWIPGRRELVLFLLFALLGFAVWAARIPAGFYFNPPYFLVDQAFDTGVILYAILALLLGFFLPEGFYLWGVAIVVTHPFAAITLSAYQQSRGWKIVQDGIEGWLAFFFVLVLMTITTAIMTTLLSGLGAGMHFLWRHFTHYSREA